jgi:endonuclease YncB( thermonuclease family)
VRSLVSLTVFAALVAVVIYVADQQGHLSVRDWMEGGTRVAAAWISGGEQGSAAEIEEAVSIEPLEVEIPEHSAVESTTGAIPVEPGEPAKAAASAAADVSTAVAEVSAVETAETDQPLDRPAVRAIAPAIVAPPELDPGVLDRTAPREPLSKLSLALPPTPETVDDWDGTTLFRPLAPAAGLVEAMGYSVSVAGADVLPAGQTCEHKGRAWDCGTRARTAFRGFLRGRAVICALPEGAAKGKLSAPCRIGKQNLGKWLVANGWAPASAGGPFEEAGKKARDAGKGIYGPPPDMAEVGPVQVLRDLTPPVSLPMPGR